MTELLGSFTFFVKRVMAAAKKGGLKNDDCGTLSRLLTRTRKKNLILARGMLSALSIGGATDKDVQRFGNLLEKAHQRITADKEPFSKNEKDEIGEIFKKAYVSEKAAKWFAYNLDELVANEIEDFIKGRQIVASKKTVRFETAKDQKKITV
ncbi:MAG: hypothetical protein ABII22_05765 [Candidatus Micrarchaeota archaeon]